MKKGLNHEKKNGFSPLKNYLKIKHGLKDDEIDLLIKITEETIAKCLTDVTIVQQLTEEKTEKTCDD